MKIAYQKFIEDYSISSILNHCDDISYTQKLFILTALFEKYDKDTINMALNDYYINYVSLNRHDMKKIKCILIGLCNRYKKEGINEKI